MYSYLLDKKRSHASLFEIALIHPSIDTDDIEGILGVTDELVLNTFLQLEHKLFYALFFIDVEKVSFRTWTLVLDGLTVHIAKDKFEKLPDAIQVATMNATHSYLVLRGAG